MTPCWLQTKICGFQLSTWCQWVYFYGRKNRAKLCERSGNSWRQHILFLDGWLNIFCMSFLKTANLLLRSPSSINFYFDQNELIRMTCCQVIKCWKLAFQRTKELLWGKVCMYEIFYWNQWNTTNLILKNLYFFLPFYELLWVPRATCFKCQELRAEC